MINLSGKPVQDELINKLKEDLSKFAVTLKLIILQIGHNPESEIYIKQKKKTGDLLGIKVESVVFDEDVSEEELLESIEKYNNDTSAHGIIMQLPIPRHISQRKILNAIKPSKDVDGLGSVQSGLLYAGDDGCLVPATARGIMSMMDYYGIKLAGQNVCIVGRSILVGKPLAMLCLKENATVTVCHSHTKNLKDITRSADILIVAVGKPNFIDLEYVREGQVIIDVGINRVGGKIYGDVDFYSVKDVVSAITPVPGGVGPLTVVSLFCNLADAQKYNNVLK